jgi:hypothetical protein
MLVICLVVPSLFAHKSGLFREGWWFIWISLHLIRELLEMNGLKKGAVGAVEEKSP